MENEKLCWGGNIIKIKFIKNIRISEPYGIMLIFEVKNKIFEVDDKIVLEGKEYYSPCKECFRKIKKEFSINKLENYFVKLIKTKNKHYN